MGRPLTQCSVYCEKQKFTYTREKGNGTPICYFSTVRLPRWARVVVSRERFIFARITPLLYRAFVVMMVRRIITPYCCFGISIKYYHVCFIGQTSTQLNISAYACWA